MFTFAFDWLILREEGDGSDRFSEKIEIGQEMVHNVDRPCYQARSDKIEKNQTILSKKKSDKIPKKNLKVDCPFYQLWVGRSKYSENNFFTGHP